MYTEVFFDIETQKLFDEIEDRSKIEDLGISIVSAYKRTLDDSFNEVEGVMKSFWDPTIVTRADGQKFPEYGYDELWKWFQSADRIIGFNSLKFDVPVIEPRAPFPLSKLNHFDIMAKVKDVCGHRIGLNALVKTTLAKAKIAHGLDAVDYWASGDEESLKKLREYCEMDVALTRDLYDHGLKQKFVRFVDKWNELREIPVDFSYPAKVEVAEEQLGLF